MNARNVPLARWGVGNEMVIVCQNEFGKFDGRTLAFDSVPAALGTSLYYAGQAELGNICQGRDVLGASQRLRNAFSAAAAQCAGGSPALLEIISCWHVLEFTLPSNQDEERSLRRQVVDWVNQVHYGEEEAGGDHLHRGLSLLLRGRAQLAALEFQQVMHTLGPRMRRFFEVLVPLCLALPVDSDLEQDWTRWQKSVKALDQYMPEADHGEDAILVQLVRILRGDVSALVRHFQTSQDGCWPQLLAAVLIFKAPMAGRAVLGDLVDCCAEPFVKRHGAQFEASRIALHQDDATAAMRAIERLRDLDAWAECHMAQLFVPSTHAEFCQALIIKFACQVGLGPGRVESRPVNASYSSLALALEYLEYCSAPRHYLDLVLSRTNVLASEQFARRVHELALSYSLEAQAKRIARVQVFKWIRLGSFQIALRWMRHCSGDSELERQVLEQLLLKFREMEPEEETLEEEEHAPSECMRLIRKLLRARFHLSNKCGEEEMGIALVLDCTETSAGLLLTVDERLALLRCVFVDEAMFRCASAPQCVRVTRLINAWTLGQGGNARVQQMGDQLLALMVHSM